MKLWIKMLALCLLLASGALAAFIQSPIPPASRQNYFRDTDGDGRLDRIELKFLGSFSEEYIRQMVDSLTFDWLDSAGQKIHMVMLNSSMKIDSANSRQMYIPLQSEQDRFMANTSLRNWNYAGVHFGMAKLYVGDTTVYDLNLEDGMAPKVTQAFLKSYRGKGIDSLTIRFSETTYIEKGCSAFLEFKNPKTGKVRVIPHSSITTDFWGMEALLEFPNSGELISTRDSVRLLTGCARDSSGNVVTGDARFTAINGFYPFVVNVTGMVDDRVGNVKENTPVFQMIFEDARSELKDSLWQLSMEVLGPEFENALRDALNMDERIPLQMKKLKISAAVKIYTNLGSYVVGTKMSVNGDDHRFVDAPTRLSLRWNLMDIHHRLVSTGAYLANIMVTVEYDGRVVFKNEGRTGATGHVFGIKRR